jgi:hypothetical protein
LITTYPPYPFPYKGRGKGDLEEGLAPLLNALLKYILLLECQGELKGDFAVFN